MSARSAFGSIAAAGVLRGPLLVAAKPSSLSVVPLLVLASSYDAMLWSVACAADLWHVCEDGDAGTEMLRLKVSEAGSVVVEKLMEVERYSHVMHISSTVTGRLLPELDAWDALRAALPAGTVSGAPKVRHDYSLSTEWYSFVVLGMPPSQHHKAFLAQVTHQISSACWHER